MTSISTSMQNDNSPTLYTKQWTQ